ncbi:MAG: malectin domain-containing carbohydrate-binding protein [Kiritimatiellia bacterium]|jgi:hypothetical protein|nr:malectin domain-containing carbohydrate-binding protein [Kiritimatiellia bacterium]
MKASITALTIALGACSLQATEYHVSTTGLDGNAGSKSKPFKTISAAAQVARPGDVITVHEGVYRERVNPPRGGLSDNKRIVYQAAPGEKVVIKGSEIIKGWEKVQDGVWKVALPNKFFGDYSPYTDVIRGEWHSHRGYPRHTGTVYLNGTWLDEARELEQVLPAPDAGSQTDSKDKVLGGQKADYPGRAISGTEDDVIYQTCRYNLNGYRFAVPDGTYRVTLKFCEPHFDSKGKRLCDVKLQGKKVLGNFDIFAKVGQFAAHDESFDDIEVEDGELKLDIINRVSMACISGIEIQKGSYSKRINCGGPQWKGYQRDPATGRAAAPAAGGRPLWKAEVDETKTTIWAQFKDLDPNKELVEINVRRSVFYPGKTGQNYITVRGFTMRHAATPWSGAMSEQIGLIGTHWSKGWIIENNIISHSMNTGITLGRYDLGEFGIALPAVSAPGFVKSCELALEHGWSKEKIGSHIVRNNHISHCEKNGIHGSLGGIFCTIEGNTICDIAMRGWIGGPDVAGLKLLASNDVIIRRNHIYRCGGVGGLWLDWMAQGTRVTGNLLHDNSQDLFMEVDHGPFLIDHNLFLSGRSLRDWSQGGAYAHNLFAGSISFRKERRQTPYFRAHSMKDMRISSIQDKDLRFYNNIFIGRKDLAALVGSKLVKDSGNLFLEGVKSSIEEKDNAFLLNIPQYSAETSQKRVMVTTELLGKAKVPDAPFEQPDGTPYRLDTDYSGKKRNAENPAPGPFQSSSEQVIGLKVWPK